MAVLQLINTVTSLLTRITTARHFDPVRFINIRLCVPTSASKAVDCLLDSKWAKAKKGEEALFTTRESVLDYCNRLAARHPAPDL